MTRRPRVLLSMWEDVVPEVFPPRLRDALHRTVDLLDDRPLHSLDDPVAEHLPEAELLLTSWGAIHVDDDLLARAPRLRGIFHAAGSVKNVVGDAAWRRGLDVTSAVRVGAAPVRTRLVNVPAAVATSIRLPAGASVVGVVSGASVAGTSVAGTSVAGTSVAAGASVAGTSVADGASVSAGASVAGAAVSAGALLAGAAVVAAGHQIGRAVAR